MKKLYLFLLLLLIPTLASPNPLNAQSDLGVNKKPTKETNSENQTLKATKAPSQDDQSALAMLDWLVRYYEIIPNSSEYKMLDHIVFRYENIPFDTDSYNLTPRAQKILNRKALWIKNQDSKMSIVVEGHCDQRGTESYNKYLGTLRANAAKQFLVNYGISKDQLKIKSAGELQPLIKEENEQAWAKNRRVELTDQ